ncbi:MAG: VWA domain-containing protein [Bryobacteraceae bacterium]
MPYSAEISRNNPTLFVFLIDQSGSMDEGVPDSEEPNRKKAAALSLAVNRLLQNLVIRCAKEEGIRDYFNVCVLGYGSTVGPAFIGPLAGREIVPISDVGNMPARVGQKVKKTDDGAGGILEQTIRLPIWFDPVAAGGTPMCSVLAQSQAVVQGWLAQHPDCFPPVVINITDGESTDGNPTAAMKALTSLASSDGNVLLFNIHISSDGSAKPIAFPDSSAGLPDQYAIQLFEGASPLTYNMRAVANSQHGMTLSDGARGYVFNADMVLVIQALDIGTRPSNLR